MSDELFEIVDDQDDVVGQALRSEVHRLGLKHRAVHVLVFNQCGEVFLQRRSMTKDCHPGVWDSSASGHLMVGETYDHAALRELEEELGWRPSRPPQRLLKLSASPETGQGFVWVYRGDGRGPFPFHPGEISEGRWVRVEVVEDWLRKRPGDFAGAFPLVWSRSAEARGANPS